MAGPPHPYLSLLATRAGKDTLSWFEKRLESLDEKNFAAAHAGAGRRLGHEPVELGDGEAKLLDQAGLLVPSGWPLSQLGRALLCMQLCERTAEGRHVALVERLFKTGDNAEREAVLKTLWLLPKAERFAPLAMEACRSHVQSVFEAIACENPYPARYLPDPGFNQLVLKAFFTEVAVGRIEGLAGRNTAELARMANAYASERRAAGRSVPNDLGLATAGATGSPDETPGAP